MLCFLGKHKHFPKKALFFPGSIFAENAENIIVSFRKSMQKMEIGETALDNPKLWDMIITKNFHGGDGQ